MNKIGVPLDRILPVAVLVGDPAWIAMLASVATYSEPLGKYKSISSMEMEYDGQRFFAISYGYGGTNLHRTINELGVFGVRCLILIANTVSLTPGRVDDKEICITYAACRGETATLLEVDYDYPAVSHPDATRALRNSAKELGLPARLTRTYTYPVTYPPKIKRRDELREEVVQTSFELEDREISTFLVTASTRQMVAGVISCNGTEPKNFHPETAKPIEEPDVVEARLATMRVALGAAAKLVVQYDFKEGE